MSNDSNFWTSKTTRRRRSWCACEVPHKCRSDRGHWLGGSCHRGRTLCPQTRSLHTKILRVKTRPSAGNVKDTSREEGGGGHWPTYRHTQGSTLRARWWSWCRGTGSAPRSRWSRRRRTCRSCRGWSLRTSCCPRDAPLPRTHNLGRTIQFMGGWKQTFCLQLFFVCLFVLEPLWATINSAKQLKTDTTVK